MNRSSSASVRRRFMAPTLALSFAGLVLAGCGFSSRGTAWAEVARNDGDSAQRVLRDGAGCYWIAGTFNQNPPVDAQGKQWCEPLLSNLTSMKPAGRR